jgi:hypothetical protein
MMIDASDSLAPKAGDDPYGLGWSVKESSLVGRVISHSGAQPGVSAQLLILLDENIVSVVISNAFGTKQSAYKLAVEMGNLQLATPASQ